MTSLLFLIRSVFLHTPVFLQTSDFKLLTFQNPPPDSPIVVKIVEPKQTGLAEVVIGAIGLSGVLFLIAILLAVVMAAVLFYLRSRDPLSNASEGTHGP
jgi:urea transporter